MAEDRIRLTGIRAFGRHGVLERERRDGQEFVVDVVLHLETSAAAMSDDLADTVDYGGIAAQIHSVLTGPPVGLLETLAERIAALALAPLLVDAVDVVVHKPQAPVSVPFTDIAVEIHRSREYPPALEVAQVLAALAPARASEPAPASVPVPRVLPALEVPPGVLSSGPMPVVPLPPVPAPLGAVPPVPPPPVPLDAPLEAPVEAFADVPSGEDLPSEGYSIEDFPVEGLPVDEAPAGDPSGDGTAAEGPADATPLEADAPTDPGVLDDPLGEIALDDPLGETAPDGTALPETALPETALPEDALPEGASAEPLPQAADAAAADEPVEPYGEPAPASFDEILGDPDEPVGESDGHVSPTHTAADLAAAELAAGEAPAVPMWHPIGSVAASLPPVPPPPPAPDATEGLRGAHAAGPVDADVDVPVEASVAPVVAPPVAVADVPVDIPVDVPAAEWTDVLGRALDQAPDGPVDVVLALGSNLGPSQEILRHAVADLGAVPGLEVTEVAPLARTAAVGGPEQPDFLNTVVLARTTLSPRALLAACQVIETSHGRVRGETWGPRTLDIDIIVHGATIAAAEDLELPHPRASQRAFVLQPWAQVAPDAVLPGLGGGPVAALATTAPDRDGIRWMALDWWTAPGD